MFNLSKEDMANEPLEDFIVNSEITRLIDEKARRETEKLKRKNKYG